MIIFLCNMGEKNRTLLPIINFVGETEVGPEAVELIW